MWYLMSRIMSLLALLEKQSDLPRMLHAITLSNIQVGIGFIFFLDVDKVEAKCFQKGQNPDMEKGQKGAFTNNKLKERISSHI